MRSRALLLLAAALPAADPAPVLRWSVDATAARSVLAQEPFALVADPAAATAAAHAFRQLRMLAAGGRRTPPFLALAEADAIRLWGFLPAEPVQPMIFGPPEVAVRVDGAAAQPWGRWIHAQARGAGTTTLVGLPAMVNNGGMVTATGPDRWLMAKGAAATAVLTAAGPAEPGAWLVLDATPVVAAASAAIRAKDAAEVDAVMPPGWRSWTPRMTATLDTAAPVFTARGAITGMADLPLGTVDPALAALVPADAEVALAGAVEPAWLVRLAPVAAGELLSRRRRPAGEAVAGTLDGRFVAWGGWSAGPLPEAVAVLGLRPGSGAAADAAITTMLNDLEPTEVPGAERAWALPLPVGGLTIARAGDRLVVAFDGGAGLPAMPGAADRPARIPATAAVWVRADLATIGRCWLPTVWTLAQAANGPIGEDPLQPLRVALWGVDGDVIDGTPSGLLLGDGRDDWKARGITELLGDAAAVDRRAALWRSADGTAVVVLRTGDAAWILVGRHDRLAQTLDGDALARALDGASRLGGPAAADLETVDLPEPAVFDRRWLPPIDTVVAHLRPWEVVIARTGDGLVWREEGLWGMTVLSVAAAHGTWLLGGEARQQAARRVAEAREQALRRDRPDLMAALDHIQSTLAEDGAATLPAQASGLVAQGLDPDRLGALWGDGEPGPVADLDRMGRWTPEVQGMPGTVWLIRIDDTWAAAFSRWGSLNLVLAPADLPARPAMGQAPVPMAP
jgi:hypothetical protein